MYFLSLQGRKVFPYNDKGCVESSDSVSEQFMHCCPKTCHYTSLRQTTNNLKGCLYSGFLYYNNFKTISPHSLTKP